MQSFKGERALVRGAGGFTGGHLLKGLLARGVDVVRAVDVKPVRDPGCEYGRRQGLKCT